MIEKKILKARYTTEIPTENISWEVFWNLATSGYYDYKGIEEKTKSHLYVKKQNLRPVINGRQYPRELHSYTVERIV